MRCIATSCAAQATVSVSKRRHAKNSHTESCNGCVEPHATCMPHQVPLVERAVKGYNKPAVHCSQMAVILEAAAAVQQDSNSKKWRLHGKIIGSKTATINRLSKAEWCQHWLSPHKETATMTCKVKPSKKANNQPARLCLSMPAWAVATTNRKKVKREQSINNRSMGTVAAAAW